MSPTVFDANANFVGLNEFNNINKDSNCDDTLWDWMDAEGVGDS